MDFKRTLPFPFMRVIHYSILFWLIFCIDLFLPIAALSEDTNTVAQMWINQTAEIEVKEAYVNDNQIYIKFQAFLKDGNFEKDFYCQSTWGGEGSEIDLTKNIIIPLQFIDEAAWQRRPADLKSMTSLSSEHWRNFRLKLIEKLTPKEKQKGVVIRRDEDELLLYYDENQKLQIIDLKDKPSHIEISKSLSQVELAQEIQHVLSEYLKNQEISDGQVVLTIGSEEHDTNLFLYVDLSKNITVGLKIDSEPNKYRQGLIGKSIKSADHLVLNGLVFGVMTRPVSTAYRLFSWARDTTYEAVHPGPFTLFESSVIPPLVDTPGMDLEAFERKLDALVGHQVSSGTIDFLIGGDEFFPRLIDAVSQAQQSILMRIFIFDNDDYAVEIADLLKRKSNEGNMEVKVLLDGMGQIMGEGKMPEDLPSGFIPPASMSEYLRKDSKINVHVRSNAFFKADHTKTIIMDEKICFTGGMNIGREYRYNWHDLMMELRGAVVEEIVKEFKIAWAHSSSWGDLAYFEEIMGRSKPLHKQEEGYPIRLLFTRVDDPQIYKAQIAAIREAKRYIYVHNSYLSDNTILYELIRARRRGVDVRVILPVNGNHEIMNASNVVTANIMFRNGIKVYFYPGMSHIKAAIYDGWLCAGSANFDKLSFKDNLELNIATSHAPTVKHLEEILFEGDFTKSLLMTKTLEAGWKQRLAEFLAEQL